MSPIAISEEESGAAHVAVITSPNVVREQDPLPWLGQIFRCADISQCSLFKQF
jgi:hypothetical protein